MSVKDVIVTWLRVTIDGVWIGNRLIGALKGVILSEAVRGWSYQWRTTLYGNGTERAVFVRYMSRSIV
jgi:hypothetical protein